MDAAIQIKGLNELLSIVYGDDMSVGSLLREIGFEQQQIEQLRDAGPALRRHARQRRPTCGAGSRSSPPASRA